MASNRGFDAENSKSRAKLIDAAGAILVDEGYYAISARNVAARAGLKPQLVHYYFRTMDDLMIAVFRSTTDQYRALHDAALAEPFPLHALWKLGMNAITTKRAMEFLALGSQREAIRLEMLKAGEHFRKHQTETVARAFEARGIKSDVYTPAGFAMLLAASARALVMEEALGISAGHDALREMIAGFLNVVEPRGDAAGADDVAAGDTVSALLPEAKRA
jgi:AcrR family transcriptional regulator